MNMHATVPPPLPVATQHKVLLKLRRSQKAGMLGKTSFMLDARVELDPEAKGLISKYGLGSLVVYDSKARQQRAESAYVNFDQATYSSTGRSLWSSAKGLANAAMMALSLRVTVSNLIGGQHIECKDLDELLGAEFGHRRGLQEPQGLHRDRAHLRWAGGAA